MLALEADGVFAVELEAEKLIGEETKELPVDRLLIV